MTLTKEKIEELRYLLQLAVSSRFTEDKYLDDVDELCDLALKGLSSPPAADGRNKEGE